jgi:hypothetical protein
MSTPSPSRRRPPSGRAASVAVAIASVLATVALLSGCAAITVLGRGGSAGVHGGAATPAEPGAAEKARRALASGDLASADAALAAALPPAEVPGAPAAPAPDHEAGKGAPTARPKAASHDAATTADLLTLRAELRVRQGLFPDAERDAALALALVPASPSAATEPLPGVEAKPAATSDGAEKSAASSAAEPLTQRTIHIRLAHALEDAGHDDSAELHLGAARTLCVADPVLVERGACERERAALVRIRMARGRYVDAEPLVLAQIADVQSRFGAYDLRLADAFCEVARFYCRQGKYALCGPLYARSFDLWKTVRDDAFAEHTRALQAGEASPFDDEFLRPRAGHAPFAAPCGLEEQAGILYKLGKPDTAAQAIAFERKLWAGDTEAAVAATTYTNSLVARGADPLDIASARHAVAFIAMKKGDNVQAEQELRAVVAAYDTAWPTLPVSERRYRVEDYLAALESLTELLRQSGHFPEALEVGGRAARVAERDVDAYDALRLDTLLSTATTYREMRDADHAEDAAGAYLDAVVAARGDTQADYAFALRTISFAYLLRDEVDASERMELQAKAIWAKQDTVAPGF